MESYKKKPLHLWADEDRQAKRNDVQIQWTKEEKLSKRKLMAKIAREIKREREKGHNLQDSYEQLVRQTRRYTLIRECLDLSQWWNVQLTGKLRYI